MATFGLLPGTSMLSQPSKAPWYKQSAILLDLMATMEMVLCDTFKRGASESALDFMFI